MAPRFHIDTRTLTTDAFAATHVAARAYKRVMTTSIATRRGVDTNHQALAERCAR